MNETSPELHQLQALWKLSWVKCIDVKIEEPRYYYWYYPPEGPAPVQDGVDVGLVEVVGAAAEVVDQGESAEQRGEEDGVRGVQQPPGPRRHRHVQHAEEAHQAVPGEVLEVEVVAVGVVECDPVH